MDLSRSHVRGGKRAGPDEPFVESTLDAAALPTHRGDGTGVVHEAAGRPLPGVLLDEPRPRE